MSGVKWDRRFIELARHVAGWSKDPSLGIGCGGLSAEVNDGCISRRDSAPNTTREVRPFFTGIDMRAPSVNIGDKFSRLTVISKIGKNGYGKIEWSCLCECGITTSVVTQKLKSGHTRSCGCLSRETARENRISEASHGHSRVGSVTPTYRTWRAMIKRCHKEDDKDYNNYGARGIRVCERWMSFENFIYDMGERPEGKTIGRIDNDGGYFKQNCRWETSYEQGINTRMTKLNPDKADKTREDIRPQSEIAKDYGVSQSIISRIKRGVAWRG